MNYNSLKDVGGLEERTAEISEIVDLIRQAERDLRSSKLLQDKDEEWAYVISYMAMSRSAKALILAEGYRPRSGRTRDTQKSIVSAAGVILGEQYKSLINKLDRMRRKYQNFIEEGGRMISRYEAGQASRDSEEFLILVNERIKEKYSQLSLLNDVPQLASR